MLYLQLQMIQFYVNLLFETPTARVFVNVTLVVKYVQNQFLNTS